VRDYNKKGRCLLASAHKHLELRFKTFSQGLRQGRQTVPLALQPVQLQALLRL